VQYTKLPGARQQTVAATNLPFSLLLDAGRDRLNSLTTHYFSACEVVLSSLHFVKITLFAGKKPLAATVWRPCDDFYSATIWMRTAAAEFEAGGR
jgi:hypothetical protein